MADKDDLDFLLSKRYDPAESSPDKFRKEYEQLARYHDYLLDQHNTKEEKCALLKKEKPPPTLPIVPGSRFGVLSNDDDGSPVSRPNTPQFSKSLLAARVDELSTKERRAEVNKIVRDIAVLKSMKKERRAAGGSASEEKRK